MSMSVVSNTQRSIKKFDWFSNNLHVTVPSPNWLPGVSTHGDNLQSTICHVISVRCHSALPPVPSPCSHFPPTDNVKMQNSLKTNIKQNTMHENKGPLLVVHCPFWHHLRATTCMRFWVCVARPTCDGHNRPGQMASPPTNPTLHTRACAHTGTHVCMHVQIRMPEAQPQCLVAVVVACSSSNLILSLRAAGESYICATFACDVCTEIEVKEPAFEPTIQLCDNSG